MIAKKYTSYIDGFKLEQDKQKPIHAYVFYEGQTPIGYIQYYNIHDFARDTPLPDDLPTKSAVLDFYIGDPNYLNKGYGRVTLKSFCENIIMLHFDACFVDPDPANEIAIRCYQSAGFEVVMKAEEAMWMRFVSDMYNLYNKNACDLEHQDLQSKHDE